MGLIKKYFVSETMKEPSFYEGQIHYQVLQDINKSMIENVKVYENSVNDLRTTWKCGFMRSSSR